MHAPDAAGRPTPGEAIRLLDRLDPRTRILSALSLVLAVVAQSDLVLLALLLVLAVLVVAATGQSARRTLARIAAIEGIVLLMLAILPFAIPGEPAFALGGLVASVEGLSRAAEIALKANAAALVVLALLGGLEPAAIGAAITGLGLPGRLAVLFVMTLRYRDVLAREAARLSTAMRARGFRPRTSLHTFRTFGHFAGMLLVRSAERADRVLAAMRCRGYRGRLPPPEPIAFGRADVAFGAAVAAATGAILLAGALA